MKYVFAISFFLILSSSLKAQEIRVWDDPESAYKAGIEAINFKNYLTARLAFEDYLNKEQNQTENLHLLQRSNAEYFIALAALETGTPDAETLFLDFIKENHETPYYRLAFFHLGRLYYQNRKYREAIKWFEQVDETDLSNEQIVEFRFKLGYSHFLKKDFDEAKVLFKDLISIQDEYYYPSNYYYGLIHYYTEDYETALKHFLIANESNLYAAIIPYYLAQTYFQLEDYQQTIEFGSELVADEGFKYRKELNQIIGQSHFELEQYEEALPYLETYVDLSGRVSKNELYQLAYTQYKNELYDDAIESFKEFTVVQDSLGQNALFALADCYLITGQKDKARSAFQTAASAPFDPFIVEASTFNYAKLSYELKYHNASITTLEQFLKDYPSSSYRNEAEELLTEALLTSKNYDKAIQIIESFSTKSNRIKKAYQQVTYYRALELFADKKTKAAEDLLSKSMKYPVDQLVKAKVYFLLAEVRFLQKKYEAAISDYNSFNQLAKLNNIDEPNASPFKASYGLGYSYFKLKDYQGAIPHFQDMRNSFDAGAASTADELLLADGSLRAGDCYFMIKNYDAAVSAYDVVLNRSRSGKDYALLQKSLVLGLQKNYQSKLNTLSSLLADYPNSVYADQALFEKGRTYKDLNQNQSAIQTFQRLIDSYPNSAFRPKAMIQTGVIHYRMGNTQNALEWFDQVVENYPNSDASKEALTGIKEIHFEAGNPAAFYDYLDQQDGITYSPSEKDSTLYLTAYEKYQLGKTNEALSDFNQYITSFPKGFFVLPARNYRAAIHYSKEDFESALLDYEWVIENGRSEFSEIAYQRAARIRFSDEDYALANAHYNEFYKLASSTANSIEAEIGLMRTSYIVERYTEAKNYAGIVLEHAEKPEEVIQEAHFYFGRSAYELADYETGKRELEIVANGSTGKRGAEAQFYLAQILHKQEKYQESLDACFDLSDRFASYEYWVVKAFILMSDNYVGMDNLFQAKATLESILDNYDGDQSLVNEAQAKYDAILVLEGENSRIIPDSLMAPNDSLIPIDPNE